jgi:hypothetical protein
VRIITRDGSGAVFRQVNVIEFKSPDGLSPWMTFPKRNSATMAYCYLYTVFHPVPVTDLSLTLVWSGYPREAAAHIRAVYGWEVREREHGIHEVSGAGMPFPVQIIESRKLPDEENLWLKSLGRGLARNCPLSMRNVPAFTPPVMPLCVTPGAGSPNRLVFYTHNGLKT